MADFLLRHKLLVIIAWLVLAALGFLNMGAVGPRLDYTYATPGQIGYESNLKITHRFGIDPAFEAELPVLQLPAGVTMASSEGQSMAAQVFDAARTTGPIKLQDYANTHDPKFLLDGGRATWALISIPNPDYGPGAGIEGRLPRALQVATPPNAKLVLTGYAPMLSNAGPNAKTMMQSLFIGAVLALVVLFLVYGSPIAILPILMAIPSILVAFLTVFALTHVTHVSYFVSSLIVILSLGISIDFSLMVVIRWREECERGLSNPDAVISATRSAGRAVALSGLTAAVGLLSLVVLPVPFLRSVGFGSMVIPFVAVCVATTLLPVCLALFGPALDRFCLWPQRSTTYSRAWARWGEFILSHRWKAAAFGVLFIAITTLPIRSMQTGMALISALVQTGPAAEEFHRLQANGIPSGIDFPVYVMSHGGAAGAEQARTIAAATPGVYAVLAPDLPDLRAGQEALLTVIPIAEGSTDAGKSLVATLRGRLSHLPGGPAEVGGATAESLAFTAAVYGNFPLLLIVVSLVTMVILVVSLRSVVLGAEGCHLERRLPRLSLWLHGLLLAARTRFGLNIRYAGDRGDPHVDPSHRVCVAVRPVDGL